MPRLRPRLAAHEEGAEAGHVVQVEADLARRARAASRGAGRRRGRPGRRPSAPPNGREAPMPPRARAIAGQDERDQDAQRRKGIDGLRVEVGLLDHPGPDDHRAEDRPERGDEREPAAEPLGDDREQRDRDERGRVVEEDERPARPGHEAVVTDVVELGDRQAGVGDPHRQGDDAEEDPDRQDLGEARAARRAQSSRDPAYSRPGRTCRVPSRSPFRVREPPAGQVQFVWLPSGEPRSRR